MSVIPCYRGGHHCTWPACPLDCDGRPGRETPPDVMTHCTINGVAYKRSPSGNWVPDYSVPGTAEAVNESVDKAYDQSWSIDKWRI